MMIIFYAATSLLDIHILFHSWSVRGHDFLNQSMAAIWEASSIAFYFYLLRGTRKWLLWGISIGTVSIASLTILGLLGDLELATFSDAFLNFVLNAQYIPISIWIIALLVRKSSEGLPDSRLLLGPVLLQQLTNIIGGVFIVLQTGAWIQSAPDWFEKSWNWPFPISLPPLGDACFLIAILAVLVYRFTRTRQQEERLSNELEAARIVQQVMIPQDILSVPGFAIDSLYQPASQVGGDFFQIIPTPKGGLLIVIGDVSGKGMPAAMMVSLLVGTLRTLAHYTTKPGEIFSSMNQRMLARSNGGFTTCLVVLVSDSGTITAANAGHIPPYLAGHEVPLESGLPLGLSEDSAYPESIFTLGMGEQLTLVTDGVVEAQTKQGELFGFDRTAAVACDPAAKIARAARDFGQEDDITVVTLSRVSSSAPAVSGVTVHLPSST
jgi:hypothetical protein